MPRDLEELAGIWIVSEPLKQLFEQLDAEAFAFVACDFSLADGSPAPQYYLAMCCADSMPWMKPLLE